MKPLERRRPVNPPAILYSDQALLVVDKPAGLLSAPGRSGDDVRTALRAAGLVGQG
ncbi:MAG: hypothetical protein HUU27_12640, partial [Phycisphaerae bacterium]|nr:hypothetical protein [Phycisphaerae bacterium]